VDEYFKLTSSTCCLNLKIFSGSPNTDHLKSIFFKKSCVNELN
jgi:hypothetical protein